MFSFNAQPLFFVFFAFLTFFSLVSASPISATQRDVWTPAVITPTTGTTWTAGKTYTVTWDNSSPPTQITNPNGQIYLRQGDATQSSPIAQGFALSAGEVNVTVPTNVTAGDDWRVVLFGDSGNWSNVFSIVLAA